MAARTPPAIRADGLVNTYGRGAAAVRALDGLGFAVPPGTVFGLLGPNGAGKSTTVKVLSTLSRPDAGTATVAGHDVLAAPRAVREAIGYVAQKPAFDPMATGRENLVLAGRVRGLRKRPAAQAAETLLARFGLTEAAGRLARTWSGGMQRKLDVAMGLVHRPRVLFLDEPTTGLDPQARAELWDQIAELTRQDGLTVLLTTHYLDEADRMADELAIVDHGRIVVRGTPDGLKADLGGDTVRVSLARPDRDASRAAALLRGQAGVSAVNTEPGGLRASVVDGARLLPRLIEALTSAGVEPAGISVARPTLDDVYLRHAGRAYSSGGSLAPVSDGGPDDRLPGGSGPGDGSGVPVAASAGEVAR
jgi:ABC-2 type transport system ATP-binding protein